MTHSAQDIYNLLPAIYRIRDEERGGPLKSLVSVLSAQAGVVEADIARMLDNWFIETCEEWVVPYLGDLLGVRGLHRVDKATFSLRARVANTIAYRRRKGTATMLEQLARDTTGWPARAVEFFELLATTQHYNHLRPHSLVTPDLRRTDVVELLDSPFDRIAHTADVRSIASRRGKHNITNVGLFLWRLQNYPLIGVAARAVAEPSDGRYTFNPLGLDAPLFNLRPQAKEITQLAEEINVPGELRRRPLYEELEARRAGQDTTTDYFGQEPMVRVFINGETDPVPAEKIAVCDLSDWHLPDPTKGLRVAVDPKLGRMTFPTTETPGEALVNYGYAFSGDVGGGPYNRQDSVQQLRTLDQNAALIDHVAWHVGVAKIIPSGPGQFFMTLTGAVNAWNDWSKEHPGKIGVIALLDSRTYVEDLSGPNAIEMPEGSQLLLVAADWPVRETATGGTERALGQLTPAELRPHLRGNLTVTSGAPAASATPGELIVNGLLLEGRLTVEAGHLGGLLVQHSTVAPASGGLKVEPGNEELSVRLEHSICGGIDLHDSVKQLRVNESIVDGAGGESVQAPGALADLQASTFFGEVAARMLEAGNSIFMAPVKVTLRQAGCVRFCFLPEDSVTPRRCRCQPDLALKNVNSAAQKQIRARVQPAFTATAYGQPGYAQLRLSVPLEIRAGADDGAEMGVFRFLKQPQRETNLRASLDEYLRFGLEAGIFYAT